MNATQEHLLKLLLEIDEICRKHEISPKKLKKTFASCFVPSISQNSKKEKDH